MGVLRPVAMAKIGILGLKDDREAILTTLHDLKVAQIETVSAETLAQLAPERASDTQRAVGDEALRFRGLKNSLPPMPVPRPQRFADLGEILAGARAVTIDDEVGSLQREADRLQTEARSLGDTLDLLGRLSFYRERLAYLQTQSLLVFYGEGDPEEYVALRAALPAGSRVRFADAPEPGRFLALVPREQADPFGRSVQGGSIRLVPVPRLEGTVVDEAQRIRTRQSEVGERRAAIALRLYDISARWYPRVAALEEALAIQNRLFEVYPKLGAGSSTFAAEGWVPKPALDGVLRAIDRASGGRAHAYAVPTEEEAPTLLDNPAGIRRYEFFVRFYSLPQASEWDPTLVFAIVFPIFFGFMLGDWGYGLTILLVSIWMIEGFPGARHLPKKGRTFVKMIMGPKGMQQLAYALIPGCLVSIALGLYFDLFFGFSVLGALIGYAPRIRPDVNVGLLLLVAGYIGLGMVTLGFAFGALKAHFHGHRRQMYAKIGGILFAWGIAELGLSVIYKSSSLSNPLFELFLGLIVAGLALMVGGEGIQTGMMGLIEVVSHILSYTRLIGILLASVILARVINLVSTHLLVKGGTIELQIAFVVLGLVILVVGQTFNVILGVFEPGIQGARLIFVEYFSKFYTGNGHPFHPFGAARRHTLPPTRADPSQTDGPRASTGPLIRGPESASP